MLICVVGSEKGIYLHVSGNEYVGIDAAVCGESPRPPILEEPQHDNLSRVMRSKKVYLMKKQG